MTDLNNEFDYNKTYYKVLRKDMTHRGFKYEMGLNIDTNEFNNNPKIGCVKGGLYFTDKLDILNFINYGEYLAEITIPSDAKLVRLLEFDILKYRTDKFIINSIAKLHTFDTLKTFINANKHIKVRESVINELIIRLVDFGNYDLVYEIMCEYDLINKNNVLSFLKQAIIVNNKGKTIDFVINKLNWYKYFSKFSLNKDYGYMKILRKYNEYDTINFIYDNNL